MEVVLTKQLEDFVKAKVAEGRYLDESEVVREAIRRFEDRERIQTILHGMRDLPPLLEGGA